MIFVNKKKILKIWEGPIFGFLKMLGFDRQQLWIMVLVTTQPIFVGFSNCLAQNWSDHICSKLCFQKKIVR
jgi:hypothetical protein